jgi:hypothetical protein
MLRFSTTQAISGETSFVPALVNLARRGGRYATKNFVNLSYMISGMSSAM